VVRVEGGAGIAAAALAPALVRKCGGLAGAVAHVLRAAGRPPLPPGLAWTGTPRLTRRVARPWDERLLAVGDAAGYVEPFTGEGIAWALRSAEAVAALAADGWRAGLGREGERTRRALLAGRQRSCRLWARALRAPPVVALAVRLLARAPGLARPFVRGAALGAAR